MAEHSEEVMRVLDVLDTINSARATLDPAQLRARYVELEELRTRIDFELIVVENALRAANAWTRPGRPRKPPTHTPEEAKEAHRLWMAGQRSAWIDAGYRQYERENKRTRRQAARQPGEAGTDTPKPNDEE
jgi:hypothetical protein